MAVAANALNCYFDRDLDSMMPRTRHRPLPAGRLKPGQAVAFGAITGSVGLFILGRLVGLLAAGLALSALVYYILVYTVWLKRNTYWGAVIGSGAGALPPLIGWAAVTGRVETTPLLLFSIIVLWTPPHFWSLAIFRHSDYELAGLRVIPAKHAARWIMVCSFLLVSATLVLMPVAGLGWLYLCVALLLGLGLLIMAVRLPRGGAPAARRLYFYSILYLVLIFVAMVADRLA